MTSNTKEKSVTAAIIGIGCMFAKSGDVKAFLHLLMRGKDGISDPPSTHRKLKDYFDPDPKRPDHIYCNRGGFLPQVDFDPTEFGIPPHALEATDTSQLLGLLAAKQALRDAGYGDGGKAFDRDKTSVIIGVTGTQELVIPLGARLGHPLWRRALSECGIHGKQAEAVIQRISDGYVSWQENSFPGLLGNVVAGRIANRLDLGGTNCVVDAACASSMGALHTALLELTTGQTDMVVTGGVDTINDAFMHMCFAKTLILSKSGDIRPFSQKADGTVLGEGIGLVVLKRLEDARHDGDRIYAVIKGIGSSSDGKSQSIYAPRLEGQAKALTRAYRHAGVSPTDMDLMEAHGTGTRVGDQVEFNALCEVFKAAGTNGHRCALGSVKSNIGHTKAAAGTAGLIKAALSVYHKILPPTLKADPIDPNLHVESSPFYINARLRPWVARKRGPRRAGVSAFGFGGSNFHAVLEEADSAKTEITWDGAVEIVPFSAPAKQELVEQINNLQKAVENHGSWTVLGPLAATLRHDFKTEDPHRLVLVLDRQNGPATVARACDAARVWLTSDSPPPPALAGSIHYGTGQKPGDLAFLFPGQGSQYAEMGRDLVCMFPQCLNVLEEADRFFEGEKALDDLIYPIEKPDAAALRPTWIAQPAIGAVSVAMLEALTFFGIKPDATCGHSYGELVALFAAGWITREELWKLSVARGRLMDQAGRSGKEPGTMLAVKAPLTALGDLYLNQKDLVLANRNSPDQGVFSGSSTAIAKVREICAQRGWPTVALPVSSAFHSSFVADACEPFQHVVKSIAFKPGRIPVMSNTLGTFYPETHGDIQRILSRQIAEPVDFINNIENLDRQGIRTFIEIGPKTVLSQLTKTILEGRQANILALDQSSGRETGIRDLANVLGQLAALGYFVDLCRWEKPAEPSRQPKMVIPLSGANYRAPSRKTVNVAPIAAPKPGRPTQKAADSSGPDAKPMSQPASASAGSQPASESRRPTDNQISVVPTAPMKRDIPMKHSVIQRDKKGLQAALAAVQQGLASLQALQAQTARAHEKFLETQTEAGHTLRAMLQSAGQLAGFTGDQAASSASGAPWPVPTKPVHVDDGPGDTSTPSSRHPLVEAPVSPAPPAPVQPQLVVAKPGDATAPCPAAKPQTTAPNREIQSSLIDIVSELTGYPTEMLDLSMDIEADLGIDSIKRVEILSALEERLPALPKVTPDLMGTLKTLGQICDFLGASSAPVAVQPQVEAPDTPHAASGEIQTALVAIVSELTGYPTEMLDLSMDIEADLGIDSIKRVEILSALEERLPALPKVTPDLMGTLKTLGQICDFLGASSPEKKQIRTGQQPVADHPPESHSKCIQRRLVDVIPKDRINAQVFRPADDGYIAVAGEQNLGRDLVQALQTTGLSAEFHNTAQTLGDKEKLAGLVLVAPMEPLLAFEWASVCGFALQNSGRRIAACFTTVSFLDGAFGFYRKGLGDPQQGALAGLVKTAALEWQAVRCCAIDIDPAWQDRQAIASALADEIRYCDTLSGSEIGLSADRRIELQLKTVDAHHDAMGINLGPEDVVVISGGARGVTAAAAEALADHTQCKLALLGRSPLPEPEPDWLAPLEDEGQIKKALIQNHAVDSHATPKVLESAYRSAMANRAVLGTLENLKAAGHSVQYFALDVTDADAVKTAVKEIGDTLGPVKALIHGAGVLEDSLIVDKTSAQCRRVYNTKVHGLQNLLHAMDLEALGYIVLFSSVSARMGNKGQADYAMANEVLNKTAAKLALTHPHCKVVAINWGPWDGGMVTPALKRAFLNRGVALIPLEQGTQAMLEEMAAPPSDAVEVVLGAAIVDKVENEQASASNNASGTPVNLTLTAKREIDVERVPVLQAHQLDGRPVVPFALMTEWLAHSALHANPGLALHSLENLRLHKGIVLDQGRKIIRLMAGNIRRNGQTYEVDVEIRDGVLDGKEVIHSKAKAILLDRLPAAPAFSENGHFKSGPDQHCLEDIYSRILFHGKDLHGIKQIIRLTKKGMTCLVSAAPKPDRWMTDPLRSHWIADPLVLDSAFQMAIIWCYEQTGLVCLPSYANAFRQYRERFPSEGVSAVMELKDASSHKMICDFTFLDADKSVVASLESYEAIMNKDLFKAFKTN